MPTLQVQTGQFAQAQHGAGVAETELTTGPMSDCIGLAVFRMVGGAPEICLWHVAGGWLDTRSQQYKQVKAFVRPYAQIHAGFGPKHTEQASRRRWFSSTEFEELLENSMVMPRPGDPPPNATYASYHGCNTFTVDTLRQVASDGGVMEPLR